MIGVAGYDPDFQRIYVGNTADSLDGTYTHGLLVFKHRRETARCTSSGSGTLGNGGLSASPVTANGVVYFGDASGHQLVALDELTHKKLWTSRQTLHGAAQTEPIVINGHVYETTGSGLYASGSDCSSSRAVHVPEAPRPPRPPRRPGSSARSNSIPKTERSSECSAVVATRAPSMPNVHSRLVALTANTASSPSAPR